MTTRAPLVSSASVKARPSTGWTPSTEKKLAVTRRPMTSSGAASPVRFANANAVAAMSVNDRFITRQS